MRTQATYSKYLYYINNCSSPKKIFNYFLNLGEKRLKRIYLRSMPVNLVIEPGNICNLSCPGCVTGARHPDSMPELQLDYAGFKAIFDQIKDYVFSVFLYNWGEPFLIKDIFAMIAYASNSRCGTTVHTNFNIFSNQMAEETIKSRLTHIYLSIDGATQKTYEQYRAGGCLNKVFENIELIVEKKRQLKSNLPFLTWKYLLFPYNADEVRLAEKKSKELGVDAFEIFPANLDSLATFGRAKYYDLKRRKVIDSSVTECNAFWDSLFVYPDGSVLPCCSAFRRKDVFGNILKQPLRQVWNNRDFLNLRKCLKTKKPETPIRYPCCECEVIKNMQ